jgi:hypothetical protein
MSINSFSRFSNLKEEEKENKIFLKIANLLDEEKQH